MCTLGFCSFIISICSFLILMYVTRKISEKMRNQNEKINALTAIIESLITNSAAKVSENHGENGENIDESIDA